MRLLMSAPDAPLPQSPFGPLVQLDEVPNVVPAGGNLPASSPKVASPIRWRPNPKRPVTSQFSLPKEVLPVRLTRFVEMSDSYNAH